MVYFSHRMRALLVGITLIVLTSAFAAAQVRVGGDTAPVLGTRVQGGLALEYCQESQATHDRLSAFLDKLKNDKTYQESMRKTEELIRSAEADRIQADENTKKLLIKTATSELKNLFKSLDSVKGAVERMQKLAPAGYEKQFMDSAELLKTIGENAEKLEKSAQAGAKFGMDMQNPRRDLSQDIESLKKLWADSGIFEEILTNTGENLAPLVLGPLGPALFRAFVFSVEYIVATQEGLISASVRNEAQANLGRMRSVQEDIQSQLYTLDQLVSDCKRAQNNQPKEDTQQADLSSDGGGGGGNAATIPIVIGTVAAGGAAAAYAVSQLDLTGTGSGSCGPSPGAEVNAACFGPGGSACKAAVAKMTAWCQCNKFSTFNVNTGGCQ
ncbi:hypothetical protein MYX65_10565 [Acidobacteria bacterium AH-259-L09]|nr:hypothetical protein [Acidobacteria bacterium AH-259-L09]